MKYAVPTERSFGRSVGAVCMLLAAVAWWRDRQLLAATFGAVGGVLLILALVAPAALRLPNRLWWRFAQALGWINARVILSVFFFLVLTPVGLVMRLFGRNPLYPVDRHSGWSAYTARRASPKHYERMF